MLAVEMYGRGRLGLGVLGGSSTSGSEKVELSGD